MPCFRLISQAFSVHDVFSASGALPWCGLDDRRDGGVVHVEAVSPKENATPTEKNLSQVVIGGVLSLDMSLLMGV
jgi:hypothetical protein